MKSVSRLVSWLSTPMLCAALAGTSASASASAIELISQRLDNVQGADGISWDPSLSGDGTLVAFSSNATNLIANDRNGAIRDVYLYNRNSGEMRNLTNGGNGVSDDPIISRDGRWLAFVTRATNLPTDVPDSNGPMRDVVIANIDSGELTLVTANGNGDSYAPSISRNGRRLVYETLASNLDAASNPPPRGCVPGPGYPQRLFCRTTAMLYDRVSRFTLNLVIGESGQGRAPSINPAGTHVVYENRKAPSGLETGFMTVLDLETGTRKYTSGGWLLDNTRPIISPDGNYVAAMHFPTSTRVYVPHYVSVFDMQADTLRFVDYYTALPGAFTSDSRYLVFTEAALNRFGLRPNNFQPAVYRTDITVPGRLTKERITPVGNAMSGGPSISADGSVIAWDSTATDFAQDNNGDLFDVFVLDNNTTNRIPSALPQSLSVAAGGNLPLTLTGFDADGDTLQFAIRAEPSNGTLSGVPPELIYSPAADYSGTDQFSFVVQDAQSTSEPAEVAISISGVTSSEHTFTAEQRSNSRTIDLHATWPDAAVWTQVREYDGLTSVLWDGQASSWTGTYTPESGVASVAFNSRYWLPGITVAHSSIDVTVVLADAPVDGGSIGGFAWLDADGDARRDDTESPDVGRTVTLYRCEAPWGVVGTATAAGTFGTFEFTGLAAGKYQIGTASANTLFSPLGNDNDLHPNGFSDCVDFSMGTPQVGIGVVVEMQR